MKHTFWLSYDLGVSGDYEGIYSWLENHGAQECGSSVAYVRGYDCEEDLFDCLTSDLNSAVDLNQRARVYVIHKRKDGRIGGRYLFGKRRAPPWTGYGNVPEQEADEA